MQPTKIFFQVRDRKTGQYSRGGAYLRLTKQGKIWKTPAHVEASIDLLPSNHPELDDLEVVHFEVREIAAQPVQEFLRGRRLLRRQR